MKLTVINGSPKSLQSNSHVITTKLFSFIKPSIEFKEFFVNQKEFNNDVMEYILNSEVILFITPLYVDSLPSKMIEFMEKLEIAISSKKTTIKRVYGIVNSGFIEGIQNKTALDIISNFAEKCGKPYRFGIGIGGGEALKRAPFNSLNTILTKDIVKSLDTMATDININSNNPQKNIYTKLNIPRSTYILVASINWILLGRKNGLSYKDLK